MLLIHLFFRVVICNWCMNDLFLRFERGINEDDAEVIAYADDLVILLKADSRRGLEDLGKEVLPMLSDCCQLNKLRISASKTIAMLVKGKLDKNRLPILKISGESVRYKTEIRYLGLMIDDKMNFITHAKYLRGKVTNLIMSIKRIAQEKWGIKRHIIDILYNVVALPIITYGSAGWYDKIGHSMIRRNLMATQRALLLLLTRACTTMATVSMQVIAGRLPLDLEIIKKV